MVNSDLVRQLQALGLTQSQAYIYLFLIKNSPTRIQDIARQTGIPRSSVYQNLTGLTALGLVEEIVDQGLQRIQAYPISILKHHFQEQLVHLHQQVQSLDALGKQIQAQSKLPDQTTNVRFYKGVSGARQLFWNTLKSPNEVLVYSAFGRSQFVGKKFYAEFVKESVARNFKEKVLINPTPRAMKLISRDTGTSLARTNPKAIRCLDSSHLVIAGETFIYDQTFAVVYLATQKIVGFEIESPDFVKSQKSIFKTLWNLARPL